MLHTCHHMGGPPKCQASDLLGPDPVQLQYSTILLCYQLFYLFGIVHQLSEPN